MFLILHDDKPIFEHNFTKPQKLQTYFLIHASLDSVENTMRNKRDFYLGLIKSDELPIYAYVNATGLKLLLVFVVKRDFDKKMDMAIKDFLTEVNKKLAVVLMNPLYKQKDEIKSAIFKQKVESLGNEYLKTLFSDRRKQ